MATWVNRSRVCVGLAVVTPFAVTAALAPMRARVEMVDVALLLVVVVVAVAALGSRLAGYLAALSAGAWFNYFFIAPYQQFRIADRSGVQTFTLLMIVGAAVTELAVWGRRQQAAASREAGYLAGINAAAASGATGGGSRQELIKQVASNLVEALHLQTARYQSGVAGLGDPARLQRDGQIMWQHARWDVDHQGLPGDTDIELLVEHDGRLHGRYLLRAAPHTVVSLSERRVALTLADQVGAALG
ncbi:hypothetical protein GCM10010112_83250 [Actinoplanes lobatus]|uniref:K+-sensing histidine kinase KdpD n=1 Tax=Actinoplanes lobatus TaxID=113568 RepID=A0A7W7MJE2_9ACTN|nr:DUF4118 domain-containing protein [Actinoplanes lobatus]MBB4752281.1 K+-sensing histidine kinase KdpD [Actinoplanes lobatus]GGN94194.1 hypothetical protein GCM10010112_83250 [Actinoplanes lobatus]GIE45733.1 hypothetical protein Alo02nite_86310 [Actinoplanes lobatus]